MKNKYMDKEDENKDKDPIENDDDGENPDKDWDEEEDEWEGSSKDSYGDFE